MSQEVTSSGGKSCAFVIHISDPSETLGKLSEFFKERKIIIDTLNMHRFDSGNAMLILHCQVEKDRIARTVQLLDALPGITKLERLEGK